MFKYKKCKVLDLSHRFRMKGLRVTSAEILANKFNISALVTLSLIPRLPDLFLTCVEKDRGAWERG